MVDFSSPSRSRSREFGEIEVQWGKERLRVPLPPPNSPLSSLKATLFNITGVMPDQMKLICGGAVLRDDLTPLSTYGLVDNEPSPPSTATDPSAGFWETWSFSRAKPSKLKKIVMLGSKETGARVDDRLSQRQDLSNGSVEPEVSSKPVETEESVAQKIEAIAGKPLQDLEPQIVMLEAYLKQQKRAQQVAAEARTAGAGSGPQRRLAPPNPKTVLMLSEVLLQNLLKLDSLEIQGGWTEARKHRKDAVKRVQAALDRVDAAKEALQRSKKSVEDI